MNRKVLFLFFLLTFSFFESSANHFSADDSLSGVERKRMLLFPFLLRTPETGWDLGCAIAYFFRTEKKDTVLRTSDISLIGLYTTKKQALLALSTDIYFPEENKLFRSVTSFSFFPDKFWGLGNNSEETNKEDYSIKQFFVNPQFLQRFFRRVYGGITYEFQHIDHFNFIHGGVFDRENIKGRLGSNVSGIGGLITWDSRNHAFTPTGGFFAEVNYTSFTKTRGSEFGFNSFKADFRKFFRVSLNTVLAMQMTAKLSNGDVPIRNLAFLGGQDMMRGYYKGRYLDKNMMALQAEVRRYLFWRLGVVGFASMGEVATTPDDFSLGAFHYAAGGGLRLMLSKREKLNLRIDYSAGKNSSGLYVYLKEAF